MSADVGSGKRKKNVPLAERLGLSVEEAGMLLGISRDLAYDLVAQGQLPAVKLGHRLVVPRRCLEDTLASLSKVATKEPVSSSARRP